MEQYNLPFLQKSELKKGISLFFLIFTLFMLAASILSFVFIIQEDFILGLLFYGLLSFILSIYFAYIFVVAAILKKFYIEITSEYIKIWGPFVFKMVYYKEIYEIQAYKINNTNIVSILLKKDISILANNSDSLYYAPSKAIKISLGFFKDIDVQKLLLTIDEQMKITNIEDGNYISNLSKNYKIFYNNIIKATTMSVLACIIIGVFYGFTIYELKDNYIPIPLLGCLLIICAFNKYYIEESLNLAIRFLLGLICTLQVFVAIIVLITIPIGSSFAFRYIINISIESFKIFMLNPSSRDIYILVMLLCFVLGTFKGFISKNKLN